MTKYYVFVIKILSLSPSRLTVDVWSAACILAEMITGSVLFPGHDSILAVIKTAYAQFQSPETHTVPGLFHV